MSKLVFEYVFDGELSDAMILADEVEQEMGIQPAFIIDGSVRLRYNEDDALSLRKCEITETDYKNRNIVL